MANPQCLAQLLSKPWKAVMKCVQGQAAKRPALLRHSWLGKQDGVQGRANYTMARLYYRHLQSAARVHMRKSEYAPAFASAVSVCFTLKKWNLADKWFPTMAHSPYTKAKNPWHRRCPRDGGLGIGWKLEPNRDLKIPAEVKYQNPCRLLWIRNFCLWGW